MAHNASSGDQQCSNSLCASGATYNLNASAMTEKYILITKNTITKNKELFSLFML